MRRAVQLSLAVLMACSMATLASAAPIYVTGDTCPEAIGGATGFTRQYTVTESTHCVFDPDSENIQGTNAEADLYLNALAAQPDWGTGWEGLGQGLFGSSVGDTSGTFTIDPSVSGFTQFALGIKDGALPHWAIFLLNMAALTENADGTLTGNWAILSDGGALSHFALYGRNGGATEEPQEPIAEPTTLALLGLGLLAGGARSRRRGARA